MPQFANFVRRPELVLKLCLNGWLEYQVPGTKQALTPPNAWAIVSTSTKDYNNVAIN